MHTTVLWGMRQNTWKTNVPGRTESKQKNLCPGASSRFLCLLRGVFFGGGVHMKGKRAQRILRYSPPSFFSSGVYMVPPHTLSWCRFAVASLGDARAADRCASFRGRQTCCRNYRGAARHILPYRRGHERRATFCLVHGTVHHPHKAWCAFA